jgi:hypothetical protein
MGSEGDPRRYEGSAARFLRHNMGRAFCDGCLAIHTGLSLRQAAAAIAALSPLPEFTVGSARCLACGQTRTLITATVA